MFYHPLMAIVRSFIHKLYLSMDLGITCSDKVHAMCFQCAQNARGRLCLCLCVSGRIKAPESANIPNSACIGPSRPYMQISEIIVVNRVS